MTAQILNHLKQKNICAENFNTVIGPFEILGHLNADSYLELLQNNVGSALEDVVISRFFGFSRMHFRFIAR